jgi:hypothetical protein
MAQGKMVNLGRALEVWSKVIVRALRKELTEDSTVASRKLLASIRPDVKIFGNRFEAQFLMEDYWENVDKGQKPGTKPSVDKILRWMQLKKIVPAQPLGRIRKLKASGVRASLANRFGKKVFKDRRLALAEKIANAIYRKGTIKRFGYKGSGFVTDYTKTLEQRMTQSIREATGKDITIQLKQVLK